MDKSNKIDFNSDFENIKEQKKEDTLLESLLFLSKYHKRNTSAESLITGLAIYNSLLCLKNQPKESVLSQKQ